MSDLTSAYQINLVPDEFQDRLTQVGGTNDYGEPCFRLIWSQGGGDYAVYRAGGAWETEGLPTRIGYRDLLIGSGIGCWALIQWHPAVHYGTPELYYVQNFDQDTGLQILGEFPYFGKYELLYNLRWTEHVGNRLVFESMPLNSFLLDTVVPIIVQAKEISWEETKAAMLDQKAKEDQADIDMIADVMQSNAIPFHGNAVSYQKQGCRTSLVDKKIESMQRHWNRIMQTTSKLGRGLSAYNDAI
jgi:hypothetical protein